MKSLLASYHILSYEALIAACRLVDQDTSRNNIVIEFVRYMLLLYFGNSVVISERDHSGS